MKRLTNQCGIALLGILIAVTILGLMAGIAGSSWKTIMQRAKEQELLWRGDQYRHAIASYYKTAHAGAQAMLPRTLDDLLKDPRSVSTLRHLRKLYPDPLTGKDWVLVKDPAGRIKGVHSGSSLKPFKQDGFSEENKDFAGKTAYSEWLFVVDVTSVPKTPQSTNPPVTKSPFVESPTGKSAAE